MFCGAFELALRGHGESACQKIQLFSEDWCCLV